MDWKVLLRNARISRDLLECGDGISGAIEILGMCLIDNDGDDDFLRHLRWEIARLESWLDRKPFMTELATLNNNGKL